MLIMTTKAATTSIDTVLQISKRKEEVTEMNMQIIHLHLLWLVLFVVTPTMLKRIAQSERRRILITRVAVATKRTFLILLVLFVNKKVTMQQHVLKGQGRVEMIIPTKRNLLPLNQRILYKRMEITVP